MGDVAVEVGSDKVATVEIQRGPNNFFSYGLIGELADAFEEASADADVQAVLFRGEGGAFCSGLDLDEFSAEPPPALWPLDRARPSLALH